MMRWQAVSHVTSGPSSAEHLVRPARGRERRDREFFDRRLVLLPKRGESNGDAMAATKTGARMAPSRSADHAVHDDQGGNAIDGDERQRRGSPGPPQKKATIPMPTTSAQTVPKRPSEHEQRNGPRRGRRGECR